LGNEWAGRLGWPAFCLSQAAFSDRLLIGLNRHSSPPWDQLLARQRIYLEQEQKAVEKWQRECRCGDQA